MADKLMCPFCSKPLEKDDYCYIAACMNHDCDGGYWIGIDTWKQIIAWKQSATVLQKKLDKAMEALEFVRAHSLGDTFACAARTIREIKDMKD